MIEVGNLFEFVRIKNRKEENEMLKRWWNNQENGPNKKLTFHQTLVLRYGVCNKYFNFKYWTSLIFYTVVTIRSSKVQMILQHE